MYKLYTDILISKGINRDLLVDMTRGTIKLLPKDVTKIIELFDNPKVKYTKEDSQAINDLLKNEVIFEITEKEKSNFPPISLDWNNPSVITNSIIEISKANINLLEGVFKQFEDLQCYYFTIIITDNFTKKQYSDIFYFLENYSIISFDLILNYYNSKDFNNVMEDIIKLKRLIKKPILFNCSDNKVIEKYERDFEFKQNRYESNQCGCIKKENFNTNFYLYTESQKHNTCLNRKLSIDKDGNIKNCPSMNTSFGNIKDIKLEQVIKKPSFKKYWNIKKDDIAVCKDCEFRHICTDCRAYTENPDDIYSKPLKCGYSPYTNKWEDWSTNELKQKAIQHYNMQELALKK